MAFFRSSTLYYSLLTGLLLWLGMPGGGDLWPMLFVALVPLLLAATGSSWLTALRGAVAGGLCYYLLLLYWVVIVVGKYGGLHWFISLQALLLLALYMTIYFVAFVAMARCLLNAMPAPAGLFLVPALWVGIDWLRGVLFTGLPWMDLGYGLYRYPELIQIADMAGHHGITYLLVLVNILFVLLIRHRRSAVTCLLLLGPAAGLIVGAGMYTKVQLEETQRLQKASTTERVKIGIVQGNIDQSIKWSPPQQQLTVAGYMEQTTALIKDGHPALVVWPETALPFYPPSNDHMRPLREMVAAHNTPLLTGAPWYEIIDRQARKVKFFNSALLLSPDGEFSGRYYKTHLVPFGEYVPLKKFLPFLEPLVEAVGDFSPGVIKQPLTWQTIRAGVLICFESVFPDLSRQWVEHGANVLVNLTNDAWYGKSSAPHHSLAMAVLRAVETRRSVVRSANTGISAFIAPSGTIISESGLFVPWADSREVVLNDSRTVFVRFGYRFAPVCLLLSILAVITTAVLRRSAGKAVEHGKIQP